MAAARTPKTKKQAAPAARSRGQIIQKDSRKWQVRFYIERDPRTGKRKYGAVTVAGTQRDAARVLTKKLAEVDAGSYRTPSKLTLAGWLDEWLAEQAARVRTGKLAPRTLGDYRRAVNKIVPRFGALAIGTVTKKDVADLKRALSEHYGPVAAQRAFDVFRTAMKRALYLDIITVNHAPTEERIKTPAPNTAVLSREQVGRFLTEAENYRHGRHAPLFHVLLFGGLRPSEALALQWSDLQDNRLRVMRAVTIDAEGRRVLGATKTRKERIVALPPAVVEKLAQHRKRQRAGILKRGARAAWLDAGQLVFPDESGDILNIERVRTAWRAILKRAGLPVVRLYDARHSYVTTLLHLGVDARTVADQAGHSDPAMTLRRYAHATTASKQAAADKLAEAFAGLLPARRTA